MNSRPDNFGKLKKALASPKADLVGIVLVYALFAANAALAGPLVLWGRSLPFSEVVYFMPSAWCCLVPLLIGLLAWEKKWKAVALCGLLTVVCVLIFVSDPMGHQAFVRHFGESVKARQKAVTWTRTQRTSQWPPLILPPQLHGLTFRNEAYRFVKGTREWVFLPMVRFGIDNEYGYAWSKTGEPPPEESRLMLVTAQPWGDGWFFYTTT